MRTVYIININAKNAYSTKVWNRLSKQLDVSDEDVFYTRSVSELKDIIQHAVETSGDEKLFIVGVGGDGTISALINHCLGYENVSIGYFPAGSGNDFAKGFSWPTNARQGAEVIQMYQRNEISEKFYDSGQYVLKGYRKGCFVNSMGAGFDAQITKKANNSIIKKWLNRLSMGKFIYAILVVFEAFTYKPSLVEAVIDGEKKKFERTWFMTISNQQYYGGGMKISPGADSSDGMLDLTVVHSLSRLKLLIVFLSVFAGKHTGFKEVETYKVTEVKLNSVNSIPVQADGDYIGKIDKGGNLHITVQHHNWRSAEMKC
ncbi:diacylglycerol/lipid kinase family protein [Bacillus sp. AK031]